MILSHTLDGHLKQGRETGEPAKLLFCYSNTTSVIQSLRTETRKKGEREGKGKEKRRKEKKRKRTLFPYCSIK